MEKLRTCIFMTCRGTFHPLDIDRKSWVSKNNEYAEGNINKVHSRALKTFLTLNGLWKAGYGYFEGQCYRIMHQESIFTSLRSISRRNKCIKCESKRQVQFLPVMLMSMFCQTFEIPQCSALASLSASSIKILEWRLYELYAAAVALLIRFPCLSMVIYSPC